MLHYFNDAVVLVALFSVGLFKVALFDVSLFNVALCIRVNHNDAIWLGVKVAYTTTSPGRVASHSKDPL